jgi:two-component system, chemotaxis family, chemotaxis protein CheY
VKSLVVDDDPINRLILQRFLGVYGPCLCVGSAKDAEDAFDLGHREAQPFDCIFMDIMMPEKDGHQCLAALRERERELGIAPGGEARAVMISALDGMNKPGSSFFGGRVTTHVPKPVDLACLRAILAEAGLIDPF